VALRDLQATVSMSPHGEMVEDARLLMWILEARQGHSDLANTELVAYLDDDTQRKRDWAKNIGAYLVGRKSEDDLLGTANSTNSYLDRLQHTRVWYFIGMKRQIVGDSAGAGDAFHKCIDYGVTHEEYFVFAKGLIGSSPAGFHNASPYNFGGAMVILVLLAFGSLGFFCIVLAGVVVWLSLNRNSRLTVAGQPPPVSPGLPPVPPSARPTPRPVIPPPPPPQ
jgi:hypothetical protein